MYTKEMYVNEIRNWIYKNGYNAKKVGEATFTIRSDYSRREIEKTLYDALGYIAMMEEGPEFEMTEENFYDYLEKI